MTIFGSDIGFFLQSKDASSTLLTTIAKRKENKISNLLPERSGPAEPVYYCPTAKAQGKLAFPEADSEN